MVFHRIRKKWIFMTNFWMVESNLGQTVLSKKNFMASYHCSMYGISTYTWLKLMVVLNHTWSIWVRDKINSILEVSKTFRFHVQFFYR